jgi:hypothetical protein
MKVRPVSLLRRPARRASSASSMRRGCRLAAGLAFASASRSAASPALRPGNKSEPCPSSMCPHTSLNPMARQSRRCSQHLNPLTRLTSPATPPKLYRTPQRKPWMRDQCGDAMRHMPCAIARSAASARRGRGSTFSTLPRHRHGHRPAPHCRAPTSACQYSCTPRRLCFP